MGALHTFYFYLHFPIVGQFHHQFVVDRKANLLDEVAVGDCGFDFNQNSLTSQIMYFVAVLIGDGDTVLVDDFQLFEGLGFFGISDGSQ